MNNTPAQAKEADRRTNARLPQMPGMGVNRPATKWSRIISQPVSHNFEMGV
jgi:hypothetical protein